MRISAIIISFALVTVFIIAFILVIISIIKKKNSGKGCQGCTGCPMASGCEKRMDSDE